jgi:divalent metal cation (Fe/Co/Zn/Cd) transporter
LFTQLHSFSEAAERQVQCQKQCQKYAKNNAKKASELRETKKAENDALVAQGIGIDDALRPDVVEMIALNVVKKIEAIVDEDGKVFIHFC